jgi:hypothetical protein
MHHSLNIRAHSLTRILLAVSNLLGGPETWLGHASWVQSRDKVMTPMMQPVMLPSLLGNCQLLLSQTITCCVLYQLSCQRLIDCAEADCALCSQVMASTQMRATFTALHT